MRDFNTLTNIGKHRGMLADDIPGAHGGKANGPGTRSPV
jgi:hypothetical protein